MNNSLPKTIFRNAFCISTGTTRDIEGSLRIKQIQNVEFHFYKCIHNDCIKKNKCLYIFPEEHYKCMLCNKLIKGAPIYNTKQKERVCSECGETIANVFIINVRSMP